MLNTDNLGKGFRTQALSATTLTLVVGDAMRQYFTGTTQAQTVTLPVATTLTAGQAFTIVNLATSTGAITVNTSGGTNILGGSNTLAGGQSLTVICKDPAGGTGTASWDIQNSYTGDFAVQAHTAGTTLSYTATAPTLQNTSITMPFTPKFTGNYRVSFSAVAYQSPTLANRAGFAISSSTGVTLLKTVTDCISTGILTPTMIAISVFTLQGGTACTFTIQAWCDTTSKTVYISNAEDSIQSGGFLVERIS